LLAELALHLKRQGRTVPEYLDDLARRFGYYRNKLRNLVMTGVEGKRDMARMLDALRTGPPKQVGGLTVVGFEDLRDEDGRMGPFKGETDRAARNFLIFRLAGDGVEGKVCLRPSGTEPKAKAYIEGSCPPPPPGTPDATWEDSRRRVDAAVRRLADDFVTLALGTVGQTPPA
jgi:phosphoglucomutase/phosphomannomutase